MFVYTPEIELSMCNIIVKHFKKRVFEKESKYIGKQRAYYVPHKSFNGVYTLLVRHAETIKMSKVGGNWKKPLSLRNAFKPSFFFLRLTLSLKILCKILTWK